MRAARRMIVLAGILMMAVLAPLGWNQAGADTQNATFTFVKVLCADFGAIPGNHFDPNGIPARPVGTTLGEPIADHPVSADEPIPDGCVRAEGWQFVIGGESDMVENPPGRQVSPTAPTESVTWSATAPTRSDGTVSARLNGAQESLLQQGGLRLSELQQEGFAFGTLRCGLDNRNGDNAEHMGAGPTVCVAYNVGAPVTVTKVVEGSTPQGPFELTLECGNTSSTFTLDDGGSTTLWMPYDTDCSLVETNDGGANSVSFAINGEDATSSGEGEGEEADSFLEFTTPDLDLENNGVAETNIEVTNIGASADVSVTKAGSPATVAQGAPVSFTLTVTNGGVDAAEGVVLTDELPAGLTWSLPEPVVDEPEGETPGESEGEVVEEEVDEEVDEVVEALDVVEVEEVEVVADTPPCAIDGNSLHCDIGTLEPGASFTVTVTSSATVRCGVVTNENATVTSDTPDPNEGNNAAAASVGVTCPPAPRRRTWARGRSRKRPRRPPRRPPRRSRARSRRSRLPRRRLPRRRRPRFWRPRRSERLCPRRSCRPRRPRWCHRRPRARLVRPLSPTHRLSWCCAR